MTELAQKVGSNPHVSIFLSQRRQKIVVCPTTTPTAGLYVEAKPIVVEPWILHDEAFGQLIWESLLLFRSAPEYGPNKKTEWPAFQASGMKSVHSFEDEFAHIVVEAFPCFLRVEGTVRRSVTEGFFVGKYITNACEFEELGALVHLVYRSVQFLENQEFD